METLTKHCTLTHDEALDLIQTILGVNAPALQHGLTIEVRDQLAKKIADKLFSDKTKRFYNAEHKVD